MLEEWGIDPDQNFETVYSELNKQGEQEKQRILEERCEQYFQQIKLPEHPTIYDHLVLSLRNTDLIATFNWDPLLMSAWIRNKQSGLSLPSMAFLHGGVSLWYCGHIEHRTWSTRKAICPKCHKPLKKSPVLYPVNDKNYDDSPFIKSQWERLQQGLENSYMLTIFGYSKPPSDMHAIAKMLKKWEPQQRYMDQLEIIDVRNNSCLYKTWKRFICRDHWDTWKDFYQSTIARYPRKTKEAHKAHYFDGDWNYPYVKHSPIPKTYGFEKLWEWFKGIEYETVNGS